MNNATQRLVADVGGTNTRIALYDTDSNETRGLETFINREFDSLEQVLERWLDGFSGPAPTSCCIAAAAPPSGDMIRMTNIDWSFSCTELTRRFGFSRFRWLNDFQANAHALPHLGEGEREVLRSGEERSGASLAVMGPGTGLGGATLEWVDGVPRARDGEPGHGSLSPATDIELEIFRVLVPRRGEIYGEFLVSGVGLQRLYQTLAEIRGEPAEALQPADVSRRGLSGEDASCEQALQTFCNLLGSLCGDFVLATGAYGGLFLAGGIVPRMIPFLCASDFVRRFTEKGMMAEHLASVPLYAITAEQPGLIGASHAPLQDL